MVKIGYYMLKITDLQASLGSIYFNYYSKSFLMLHKLIIGGMACLSLLFYCGLSAVIVHAPHGPDHTLI